MLKLIRTKVISKKRIDSCEEKRSAILCIFSHTSKFSLFIWTEDKSALVLNTLYVGNYYQWPLPFK